ncbi:MAG: hypothetical protein ACI9W2_002643, partial [Gammaproteobacteria bacterium]
EKLTELDACAGVTANLVCVESRKKYRYNIYVKPQRFLAFRLRWADGTRFQPEVGRERYSS